MAGRVQVITPDGQRGSVDEADVDALPEGARILTARELAEERLAAEYSQASTAKKIGGVVASTIGGPIASHALSASGAVAVQPEVEALQSKMPSAVTLGADRAITKAALDAAGGPGAGAAYAAHQQDLATAHGGLQTAGELAGFAAAAAAGGRVPGAAKAVPGLGLSSAGAAAEGAVARSLGGLASRGALGRAAAAGASMAARGAVEGAVFSGVEQATSDYINDTPITGEKIASAMGHGALFGGAIGFGEDHRWRIAFGQTGAPPTPHAAGWSVQLRQHRRGGRAVRQPGPRSRRRRGDREPIRDRRRAAAHPTAAGRASARRHRGSDRHPRPHGDRP